VEHELQAIQYPRAQRQMQHYLPYLQKDALILEAGSGLNAVVITLRRMGYNVIGLDYAVNALRLAHQHTPDLPLVAGDVHSLPHPDNSLGGYLSFGVLEHFEHGMQAALCEAFRVLQPGGIAVITIPYPNIVWRLGQWRREQEGRSLIDDDFYESTYTRQQLIYEMTKAGFQVIEAIPTSHSFTLWGLGSIFQGKDYYQTSPLAEALGTVARFVAPWLLNFMTMIIARK
jgi:SAM-dependent methyltransferase